jgi:predicted metal-binding membrane protein
LVNVVRLHPQMSSELLESVLRRDRLVIAAALAVLALLCWTYLGWLAAAPAHSMEAMAPMIGHWSAADFLVMLTMWWVMMVGMMIPAAAPMILIHARVARQARERGRPFAATAWFAAGYLIAWLAFALAATALQWGLERALLLAPMTATVTPRLGGALLVAAGLYQFTPLKDSCLAHCQSPMRFIQRFGFRGERGAAVRLGLRHGAYCIGCCWALMILLFVGGVMNLLWIAAIAALVLAEKLIAARLIQRASGLAMIAAGVALLA